MCYYSHKLTYVTDLATGAPGNGRMTSQRFALRNDGAMLLIYS